jgi:hypothetical protein
MDFLLIFVVETIRNTPIWVWPLLAGLVWYGLRASGLRTTSALAVYCLPLLGLISLREVMAAGGQAMLLWSVAWIFGLAIGYVMQKRWLLEKDGLRVTLQGEWFTMGVLMTIFWLNYSTSVLRVIAPEIYAGPVWQLVFPIVIGLASGSFGGRALMVWRAPSSVPAPA